MTDEVTSRPNRRLRLTH